MQNFKNLKINFVRILKTKFQETFEKIWLRFLEEIAFCNIWLTWGPMLTERKKEIIKIQNIKNPKKVTFVRYWRQKEFRSFRKFARDLWEE